MDPAILSPAPVNGMGLLVTVVSASTGLVALVSLVSPATEIVGVTCGTPVPTAVAIAFPLPTAVPMAFPPPTAGPVGYSGVGITVTVLFTIFTVTYVVSVLLFVTWLMLGAELITPPGRLVGAGAELISPPGRLVGAGAELIPPLGKLVGAGPEVGDPLASVTGQTVVYRLITSVVTLPSLAGQSVTVGAHEVTV